MATLARLRGHPRSTRSAFRLPVADQERPRASWLELFFDLVFVVAIQRLGSTLHEDLTGHAVLVVAALFVPVWWAWFSFAYYADLFQVETPAMRVVVMTGMLGALVLAGSIPDAAHGHLTGFAAANGALQLIVAFLYFHERRAGGTVRRLCSAYVLGFSLSGALWVLTAAVGGVPLAALALAVGLLTPFLAYVRLPSPPVHVSHLSERLGLFTLILLGESIVAVSAGTSATSWEDRSLAVAGLTFVLACGLWWLYFEHVEEAVISRSLTEGRGVLVRGFLYGYGHLAVFAGLAAVGVGSGAAIEHATEAELPGALLGLLTGGVALYLVAATLVTLVARHRLSVGVLTVRIGGAIAILLVAVLGGGLAPVVVLTAVLAVLLAVVVADAVARD
jgi:low temperature requirement protein LtrA